jgi:hypothetical protein
MFTQETLLFAVLLQLLEDAVIAIVPVSLPAENALPVGSIANVHPVFWV